MYDAQGSGTIEPAIDPRILINWNLRGYITGMDAIFRALGRWALGERRVFYGLVLESRTTAGQFAVVIRGTTGWAEWGEDLEGIPIKSRYPGLTEAGFTGIAETLLYRAPNGMDAPLVASLKTLIGSGTAVVCGHSLGSALATMVAYDLANALLGQVSLRIWASPHPGNAEFVGAVAAAIPDHWHVKNPSDIVPKVPISLGYEHLPNTVDLGPANDELQIEVNLGCSHHILSYIALMDDDAFKAAASPQNTPYLTCIVRKV
jgi:hypothetical protein